MADFETMMKELENITKKLETGDLPLDEAMSLFEKGVKLTKECTGLLDKAQQKIVKITEMPDGSAKEEPFAVEEIE
ncbi:MAG: exodeoxyribonuclease VII small subunit [Bacillota bacterium]|nr:exodeoxyribonuclease VII small subunit [Bacillota bacterium]